MTQTRLKYHLLRLAFLAYALVFRLALHAQGAAADDDELMGGSRRERVAMEDELEQFDYSPWHISISDILWILLLIIIVCVFRKIWKGCSIIIILFAAAFYYMTH